MEYNVEYKEGYMGAIAWEGNNSHKHLYGSDLSKAIRAELKANGIKGVSVSCKHADSLYLKFKVSDADFKPFEEYLAVYSYRDLGNWCWVNGEYKYCDAVWAMPEDEQKKLLEENARRSYDVVKSDGERYDYGYQLSHYGFENYKMFSDAFVEKLYKVKEIVDSYNFDESNSMVDYFHRGFYEHYSVKYKAA